MTVKNRETQFMVRCNQELRDAAEKLASINGQSLVEWVRRAIKSEVERQSNGDTEDMSTKQYQELKQMIDNLVYEIENLKKKMEEKKS